ncbi:MAG: glycine zipper 2TM domain-containing protein [Simplicispira sp.]|nr:glycine zipper 2TM domain-containing protein [Simplicispira sp.]
MQAGRRAPVYIGAVVGGVLGHQIGGGSGRSLASAAGVVAASGRR